MIHIYPLNDDQEHELEGTMCRCNPIVDWEDGLVIHNAFDCREIVEEAERLKNERRET